jgi:hypothetical protein
MSLFDASVGLNPHQIEAAMFALQSSLSEGVISPTKSGSAKQSKQAYGAPSARLGGWAFRDELPGGRLS